MTEVYGAIVPLREGQVWKIKGWMGENYFDPPTCIVRILAVGKTHMALQDLNCDSHFVTCVVSNETFANRYAMALVPDRK